MKFSFLFFSIFFGLLINLSEAMMTTTGEDEPTFESPGSHRRSSLAEQYSLSSSPKFEALIHYATQKRAVNKTAKARDRTKRHYSEDLDSSCLDSGYTTSPEEEGEEIEKKKRKEEFPFPLVLGGKVWPPRATTATLLVPGMKDLTLQEAQDASSEAPLVPGDREDLLFEDDAFLTLESPANGILPPWALPVDAVFQEKDDLFAEERGVTASTVSVSPVLGTSPEEVQLPWHAKFTTDDWNQWYKDQIAFQEYVYKNPDQFPYYLYFP